MYIFSFVWAICQVFQENLTKIVSKILNDVFWIIDTKDVEYVAKRILEMVSMMKIYWFEVVVEMVMGNLYVHEFTNKPYRKTTNHLTFL